MLIILSISLILLHHGLVIEGNEYVVCKCENSTGCSDGHCAAILDKRERCFATRYERGCTILELCTFFADKGYHFKKIFMACCRDDTLCNARFLQTHMDVYLENLNGNREEYNKTRSNLKDNDETTSDGFDNEKITLIVVFLPCTIMLCCVSVWIVIRRLRMKKKTCDRKLPEEQCLNSTSFDVSVLSNSGSGIGVALLNQRTLSWQIEVKEEIGSGGFGLVRRGLWNGKDVAIKIIESGQQDLWEYEKALYMTKMLSHKNILGFIGADVKEDSCSIQRWLIFDFYPKGSVYDYLQENVLQVSSMFKMVMGFVEGLHHLHEGIYGSAAYKPSIAHRDIKTKNILVKNDGSCCIADFGLAHKHKPNGSQGDQPPPNARAGTVRYQAPEVLDGSINATRFDAFRKVDIYAFGLRVWEICRRTEIDGHVEEYHLPYQHDVPCNPGPNEMKQVVCLQEKRPEFPKYLYCSQVMQEMKKVLEECWYANPFARLPILRIRKKINSITQKYVK